MFHFMAQNTSPSKYFGQPQSVGNGQRNAKTKICATCKEQFQQPTGVKGGNCSKCVNEYLEAEAKKRSEMGRSR